MKYLLLVLLFPMLRFNESRESPKIFDVHLHGSRDPAAQIRTLQNAGVYKVAISTSWDLEQQYLQTNSVAVLYGLMVPCPNGKVPYSLQQCFDDNREFPPLDWMEEQIAKKKIHFLGEVLSQYHGISPSDSSLMPYYKLAEKYSLPVGIHTGSAGPDHGCPDFSEKMGNPALMEKLLVRFPKLRVWIMHAGVPYLDATIAIMKKYPNVYTDISAINNPQILPPAQFQQALKKLVDNGLETRIMFGSDNGNTETMISSVNNANFLTTAQREKIFFRNAEKFFGADGVQ